MENKRKVVFFGTPKEVVPVLEKLDENFTVVGVVTAPDKPVGRKQIMTPPPVKVYAIEHNIPCLQPIKLDHSFLSQIEELHADLAIVAAYGKIIPNDILNIPHYGAINIHPSLLPAYRGPTPIQSSLLDGVKNSGISFTKMDGEMDHGPILQQVPFHLTRTDTFDWLMQSMFKQAAIILPQIIEGYINETIDPQPQNDAQATYTKILSKEDGRISLDNPPSSQQLDAMIRAFYPWPNVWTITQVHGKEVRVKFLPERKIQMEGKQPVALQDFINGYPELEKTIMELFEA